MGAAKKELSVIIWDCGGNMQPHRDCARRALLSFLHSRMIHKPHHEVALLFFGTATTKNDVAQEFAQAGAPDQYQNISVMEDLRIPDMGFLQTASEYNSQESAHGDFIDALAVGLDLLVKSVRAVPTRAAARKRVIILSNFLSAASDDPNGEFISQITRMMTTHKVALEVVSLDYDVDDATASGVKATNLELLRLLSIHASVSVRSIPHPVDLAAAFPAKEYHPTHTEAAQMFEIGTTLKIPIKLATKTMREKFPSIGKESPLEGIVPSEERPGGIVRSAEWYREDDENKEFPVPDDEIVFGYRYGRDVVPMLEDDLKLAEFNADPGMKALGFVAASSIPRHYFMSHSMVMVANKDSQPACSAIAALVGALKQREQVSIVRRVTKFRKVEILVATPVERSGSEKVDYFLLNQLPFQEDIRAFSFASFDKEDWRPNDQQTEAALNLVQSMMLTSTTLGEGMAPEMTANPSLHRFIDFFVDRVLEPAVPVPSPEDDALLDRVLAPRCNQMEGAEDAAARMAELFPLGREAHPVHRAIRRLRADHVEEDFVAMMEQENYTDAIVAMRKFIHGKVSGEGSGAYDGALAALQTMRKECLSKGQISQFNSQLMFLASRYGGDVTKREFLSKIADAGLNLIRMDEGGAAGVGVTPEKASSFLALLRGEDIKSSDVKVEEIREEGV